MVILTDNEFYALRDFILNNYGIDLSKKRVLIQGRLASTLQKRGLESFTEYIDIVKNDKTGVEVPILLNKLTTNLTFFMREKEHFDFLSNVALPEFERNGKKNGLRIWSAGCSSGEEPYTIAMTMLDYFNVSPANAKAKFQILASDISQNVLSLASAGVYSNDKLKDLPKHWLTKYFDKQDDENHRVKAEVRQLITFKTINLMDNIRFSKPLDIIFCRNVMIYFEKERKERLIERFHGWLYPNGYFFISHSENIGNVNCGFKMMKPSIFKKV